MKNLTLNDGTQSALLPHLAETERLLEMAIAKHSGKRSFAKITAMPDLGLSNNAIRMNGGFFTGMHVDWESTVPFVPVDTTVNSCGVMIIALKERIPVDVLANNIEGTEALINGMGYNWNFNRGNHFITLGEMADGRPCLILHASADEYKGNDPSISLYPTETCWFSKEIRVFRDDASGREGRYLRYLTGKTAEKFIAMALSLEEKNRNRLREIGAVVAGDDYLGEYLYLPHYGMPTDHSIAIGCSWYASDYALLTAPGKKIFIVNPRPVASDTAGNVPCLNPHGFGVAVRNASRMEYNGGKFSVNGIRLDSESKPGSVGKFVRMQDEDDSSVERHVRRILDICPGVIRDVITPLGSLSAAGYTHYGNGERATIMPR